MNFITFRRMVLSSFLVVSSVVERRALCERSLRFEGVTSFVSKPIDEEV